MNDRNERIDPKDYLILDALQNDGSATIQQIAVQAKLSPSSVHDRIRKLEGRTEARAAADEQADGHRPADKSAVSPVILGYEARLDPAQLGLGLLAFVFVRADERVGPPEAGLCLAQIPEVQEIHHVAGEDCYLVKLRTKDTASLGRLLREQFGAIPAIRSTRTTIVLETLKETARLPIACPQPEQTETSPPASGAPQREAPHVQRGTPQSSKKLGAANARTRRAE